MGVVKWIRDFDTDLYVMIGERSIKDYLNQIDYSQGTGVSNFRKIINAKNSASLDFALRYAPRANQHDIKKAKKNFGSTYCQRYVSGNVEFVKSESFVSRLSEQRRVESLARF